MKRTIFTLFLLILLLFLASCAQKNSRKTTFFAMDTVMSIEAYGADEQVLKEAEELVFSMESALSTTKKDSEISRLNQTKSAKLSPETADLVRRALSLCEKTNGALDISIFPIVRAWGFTTGKYQVPTKNAVKKLLKTVNFREILLQNDDFIAISEDSLIDLGSVAKGCAADRVCALLREKGVENALLDLGGNVQVIGKKPNGQPWKIAIRAPEGEGYLGVLDAEDEAVVTSGGYERFFVDEDGITRHHIMDPATGYPAESGLRSVTIVGKSGLECDGLSTALFVMGREKAEAFWRENGGFEMLLLDEDGTLHVTEGLAARFTTENDRLEVIRK